MYGIHGCSEHVQRVQSTVGYIYIYLITYHNLSLGWSTKSRNSGASADAGAERHTK